MSNIKSIIKEIILKELSKIDQYVKHWIMSGGNKRSAKRVPAMVLLLKKLGYEKEGKIYRALFIKVNNIPFYVIITQTSKYYDLYDFIEGYLQKNYPEVYDKVSKYSENEKEVIAPLDKGFKLYYGEADDESIFKDKNLRQKVKKLIWDKNKGELLSFTKDFDSAQEYLRNLMMSPLFK